MPFKTILLHMTCDERHAARLSAGVSLARRFGAFLEVLYVASPVTMPAAISGRGASYAYLAEATAIAREKADEVEKEVRRACKDISFSWTVVEGDHVDRLAERADYADLVVVSQPHPDHVEDRVRIMTAEELPLRAACPVLVLPWMPADTAPPVGHVLVAWKKTREAGRAVRDALPFLETAERVTILTIDPPGHTDDTGRDLMIYLERHGVRTHHHSNLNDDDDIGTVILQVARDLECDGIVMGAYGHSRLRELVLGGTTRHVLQYMHVPVVMSH
ncbi:MAG TPA: universal stress protein [Azospirillaceae bacterium]|nr:universal stress protein [Azospirillaceae bacterium]